MQAIPPELKEYVNSLVSKGYISPDGCFEVSSCQSKGDQSGQAARKQPSSLYDAHGTPEQGAYGFDEPLGGRPPDQGLGNRPNAPPDIRGTPEQGAYGFDEQRGRRQPVPVSRGQPAVATDVRNTPEQGAYRFDEPLGGRPPGQPIESRPGAPPDIRGTPEQGAYGFDEPNVKMQSDPTVRGQPTASTHVGSTPEYDEFNESHSRMQPGQASRNQPASVPHISDIPEQNQYGFDEPHSKRQNVPPSIRQPVHPAQDTPAQGAYGFDEHNDRRPPGQGLGGRSGAPADIRGTPEHDEYGFGEPRDRMQHEPTSEKDFGSQPAQISQINSRDNKLSIPPRLLIDVCTEFLNKDTHNTNSITNEQLVECLKAVNIFPSENIIQSFQEKYKDNKLPWPDYLAVCEACYKDTILEPANEGANRNEGNDWMSNDEHVLI